MQDDIFKDFNQWVQLAQEDPERFEEKRQHLINETINEAPEHLQQRLKQLQWEIDGIRLRSSCPINTLVRFNDKMLNLLEKQEHLFAEIRAICDGKNAEVKAPAKIAKVLEFSDNN